MNVEKFASIIEHRLVKIAFQPIVSLRDGHVLGYEALMRTTLQDMGLTTERIFSFAEEHNFLWDLEYIARSTALKSASERIFTKGISTKLFINVSPVIIQDPRFQKGFTKKLLKSLNILESDIIFEITEKNTTSDMKSFKKIIDHYKEQKFNIAVDDLGAGYSGLNLISEIAPQYVKLDMHLIRNIYTDRLKQGLIRGIVEFSNISNISLIAEGIEHQEELETLVNLGVQYGQGYYIQKPDEYILKPDDIFLNTLRGINARKNSIYSRNLSDIYIKNICAHGPTVSPDAKIEDVYAMYAKRPEFAGLCVLDNRVPIGIVTRETLYRALGGAFGFSLYSKKAITEIMDMGFLIVDERKTIDLVSGLAMNRPHDKLYDFIVVVSEGLYFGVVTVKNLLLKTTEIEVATARHQNPLSGLPGNFIIERQLANMLDAQRKFSVAYIDLDNFKAYNDAYGFGHGDCVLKLFADKLKDLVSDECFIGHVGGDDFVAIVSAHVSEEFFADVLGRFRTEVLYFYNQTDIKNGYITASGRDDCVMRFPLLDTTCVVVDNKDIGYASVAELGERLACLKKAAKTRKRVEFSLCAAQELFAWKQGA
ncbi:MAG: GGDEF domain-containing protein [Desulfovibrionaceae bacterium]|nr:GGDEF domain-containing protein [Desulfovibrionaceae bacterium]